MSKFTDTMKGLFGGKSTLAKIGTIAAAVTALLFLIKIIKG